MLVIPFRKHSSNINPFKNSFVNIFDIRSVEAILIKNRSSKSKAKNRSSQLEVSNKKSSFENSVKIHTKNHLRWCHILITLRLCQSI